MGSLPQQGSQGGFVDTSRPITPKRLIVCCDGTWQSSVSGLKNIPSNVTRLARSIARSGTDADGQLWQQVVYYDAGIGTGDLSKEEKDRQGGFGIGFVTNVIEAYNFIVLNYNPGDQIFCFGFSRGAYTARAVAGLINDIGVIAPRDMQDFPNLYSLYQKNSDSHGFRKSDAYREWVNGVLSKDQPPVVTSGFQEPPRYDKPPHRPAPEASRVVQVVGVFDTVGSLGIPDLTWTRYNLKGLGSLVGIPDVGFHNVALSPYIRHAFHALALDEHRGPFSPTLWHYPAEGDLSTRKPKKSHEENEQEWNKVSSDKNASLQQVRETWSALIDCEMYEELRGTDSNLMQVWFPGVHINVGGGSDDLLKECKGDLEQIALISFAWMCEQVSPYLQLDRDLQSLASDAVGDRLYLIRSALDAPPQQDEDHDAHWIMNKAWELLGKTGRKKAEVKTIANDAVNGWATGPIIDSFTGAMALAGSVVRTPGRYTEDTSGKQPVKLGKTNEMIHPSVQYRMDKKQGAYQPSALKGFRRTPLPSGARGYQWTNGQVSIPEFIISSGDAFTRYLASQDSLEGAVTFISGIDSFVVEGKPLAQEVQ